MNWPFRRRKPYDVLAEAQEAVERAEWERAYSEGSTNMPFEMWRSTVRFSSLIAANGTLANDFGLGEESRSQHVARFTWDVRLRPSLEADHD